MYLIGGSASMSIAKHLSALTDIPLAETDIRRFPDGELYVRIIENLKNEDVTILQTTYPDENIIELFLLLDACKRSGVKRVTAVIPYYGYARQDRQFKSGEPVSAEALAKLISINVDAVVTVDPHKEYIKNFFSVSATTISAIPSIVSYLENRDIDLILAPDKGALDRARDAANLLECDVDYLEKTRLDGSTISIKPKTLEVNGKNIAIIDDIISTGGTMAVAVKQMKQQHADSVFVACTHGLFAGGAIDKIKEADCDEIIATDTISSEYSTVHIAPILSSLFVKH